MTPPQPAADWAILPDDALIERFAGVTVWRANGKRAPHKPLLMLYALARVQRGQPRLAQFCEIEERVGDLLRDFGPPHKTQPAYPFWHLQSDGLWIIPDRERRILQADVVARPGSSDPRLSLLREVDAYGGLPPALHDRLTAQPVLVNRIAQRLLDDNWEPSFHEAILDAVGMPWVQVSRPARDPAFRDLILRIYQHRCAVCGWDGQLGATDLALEAAHLKWHAAGGADAEDNGLALCSFHHKALDRGALSLSDDRTLLISQHLRGSTGLDEWLLRFAGAPLARPQPGTAPPALVNIHWHRAEVFRGPARSPS